MYGVSAGMEFALLLLLLVGAEEPPPEEMAAAAAGAKGCPAEKGLFVCWIGNWNGEACGAKDGKELVVANAGDV